MRILMISLAAAAFALGAPSADASPKGCPPGLAKKATPCVPPGQAKKGARYDDAPYRRGDRVGDDYIVIRDPGRYGLNPGETYYRVGDYVMRVDRDTKEVLDLIGAVGAILN